MCKIMAFTNLSKVKNVNKLVDTISNMMGQVERDGFGYAIQGAKGVFGERTTDSTFKASWNRTDLNLPFITKNYERNGVKSKAIGAGIFHGRTSTNHKTLINTHPIRKHGWTLIHNGVVTNHGPSYEAITTNDTEHILEHIAKGGISLVAESLTGYYAVAAFNPIGDLVIFKDSTAQLYVVEVKELNSLLFATSRTMIEDLAEAMGWTLSTISPFTSNNYVEFRGNQLIKHTTFKPRGYGIAESAWSNKSLGISLESTTTNKDILTYDQENFLAEVELYADSTYTIYDYKCNEISIDEFRQLPDEEKFKYDVIRPDGTVCCPMDYNAEKLYSGKVG